MSRPSPEWWQEISPYLDQALTMSDESRASWLKALRQQNPEVAARLQSLLDEHSAVAQEKFLEEQGLRFPGQPSFAGQTIGAYTLISSIGQGGMSTVWLAERSDGRFEGRVAVKLMSVALVGYVGQERFKREGSILGRIAHPHIAHLMDAGVSPTGNPYLVLEYIEGEQIDQYCDQQKLDVEARVRLFLDVLNAVAYAHANLIVHRDVKPSNVLVTKDGKVKLLDFGIAKLLEEHEESAKPTMLTREGGAALTPEYAAPEQITCGPVTTATDIYSLGVLLYVLLTGQHPAGVGPHSAADLVKAITETEPVRASEAIVSVDSGSTAEKRAGTPDKLRRQLRGDLDTMIGKALKKNPQERYSSVTTLADDLRRYLKHEPISARRDTLLYRGAKFVRRNRTTVALATLAAIAAVAGVTGTLIQARTARRQRDVALRQLARAERINELNQFLLSEASASEKAFTVPELLDHARQIVERENYPSDPTNHVELLISVGTLYDNPAKALPLLEKAYQLSRGLPDPSIRSRAGCALGARLFNKEEHARAESLFQEGYRGLPNAREFALDRVLCLLNGATVATGSGSLEEAVARARAAQQLLDTSDFSSSYLKLKVLTTLGAYEIESHLPQAIATDQQAIALEKELGYDQTVIAADTFSALGLALMRAGRPAEAERVHRQALDLLGKRVVPWNLQAYAGALRELGRLEEAADYANQGYSAALRQKNNPSAELLCLLQLVRVHTDLGSTSLAESDLSKAETIARKILSPGWYLFSIIASDRSRLHVAERNLPAALAAADQAVALAEAAGPVARPWLPLFLYRRAAIEVATAQADQAVADARRALGLLQSALGTDAFSMHIGMAYLQMARALLEKGKSDEARVAFSSAAEHFEKTLGPDHPETRAARQLAD